MTFLDAVNEREAPATFHGCSIQLNRREREEERPTTKKRNSKQAKTRFTCRMRYIQFLEDESTGSSLEKKTSFDARLLSLLYLKRKQRTSTYS